MEKISKNQTMKNPKNIVNKYDKVALDIYHFVGEQTNFTKVYNCMTRLRFYIDNKENVKIDEIKKIPLVKGINWNGNELQIIIGGEVQKVKDALDRYLNKLDSKKLKQNADFVSNKKTKKPWKERILGSISGVMVPALPVFITVGMLMGIKAIFVQTGVMQNIGKPEEIASAPVFTAVFYIITEIAFKFLGIFIGYNTMKYLGGNTVMSLLLGIAIANPFIWQGVSWPLFKIGSLEIKVQAFTSSILPHIAANVLFYYLDKWIKTWMPSTVDIIFRPLIAFLSVVLTTYFVIGPMLFLLEQGLAVVVGYLGKIPFGIGVAIFAILWQPFVVTGMHVAIAMPLSIELMKGNPQIISPAIMYGVYGQLGAMIAVIIRTKNAQLRAAGIANLPAGIIGITEPIIYGITLPKWRPFIAGCFGAGVGGLFSGMMNVRLMHSGGYGIFSIIGYVKGGPLNVAMFCVSLLLSLLAATMIGALIYRERVPEKKQIAKINHQLVQYYALGKQISKKSAQEYVNQNFKSLLNEISNDVLHDIKILEENYIKLTKLKTELAKKQERLNKQEEKLQQKLLKVKTQELANLVETKITQLNQGTELKELEQKIIEFKTTNQDLENKLLKFQTDFLVKIERQLVLLVDETNNLEFKNILNSYYNAIHSLDINYQINSKKEILFDKKNFKAICRNQLEAK